MALIIASSASQATGPQDPPEAPAKSTKRFLPFRPAETIPKLLRRNGFSESQITLINRQNLLPKGLSLSHGESYRLRKAKNGKFAEIKIYEASRNLAYVFWRDGTAAGSLKREETFQIKERQVQGRVQGSLLSSILQVLPAKWVAYRFLDAYCFDHNLPRELQRGAKFDFTVETKWDGSDQVGFGEILSTNIELRGALQKRFFVRYPGGGTFVNPKNSFEDRPLFAPVSYLRLSSFFEPHRYHPIKHRRQPHLGVDFELPAGTDIFAAESGEVLRAGFQRAAGNFVVIRHKNGYESYYNHLQSIVSSVHVGARVQNGQKIGEIGCTGYCTKAHLHFAVKRVGRFVDPIRLIKNYPYRSQALMSQHHVD